jgi:hypothetical protein
MHLPIVDDLSDQPLERDIGPIVFEIEQRVVGLATGTVIDDRGGVFRFVLRANEPRRVRGVAQLDAGRMAAMIQVAARARAEKRAAVALARACTVLRWMSADGSAFELSNDCTERAAGPNADKIISWLYAIDEQAPQVWEAGWPSTRR